MATRKPLVIGATGQKSEIATGDLLPFGNLPVGTAANTVAAGNDSRIVGAAPAATPVLTGLATVNNNAIAPANGGTTGTILHLIGVDSTVQRETLDVYAAYGSFALRRADGTEAAPTALATDDQIGALEAWGYGATAYSTGPRANIGFYAAAGWTDTSQPTYTTFNVTSTGGVALGEAMRIAPSTAVLFGTTVDDGTNRLQVNGPGKITGRLTTGSVACGYYSVTGSLMGVVPTVTGQIAMMAWNYSNASAEVDFFNFSTNAPIAFTWLQQIAVGSYRTVLSVTGTGTLQALTATITDTSSTATPSLTVTNTTAATGSQIKLAGNGGVTASKTLQSASGNLNVLSDAGAVLLQLTDAGMFTNNGSSYVAGYSSGGVLSIASGGIGNLGNGIPTVPNAIGTFGYNFSGGQVEVNFVNVYTAAATSFSWIQKTGTSTTTLLASLSPTGILTHTTPTTGNNSTQSATTAFVQNTVGVNTKDYVVGGFQSGVATSQLRVLGAYLPHAITLPAGLAGSAAQSFVAATASTTYTFSYYRGTTATTIATFVFAAGSKVATIGSVVIPTLAAGDILQIIGPATADTALADVCFSILGVKQ
jgi:hypothetical protein